MVVSAPRPMWSQSSVVRNDSKHSNFWNDSSSMGPLRSTFLSSLVSPLMTSDLIIIGEQSIRTYNSKYYYRQISLNLIFDDVVVFLCLWTDRAQIRFAPEPNKKRVIWYNGFTTCFVAWASKVLLNRLSIIPCFSPALRNCDNVGNCRL